MGRRAGKGFAAPVLLLLGLLWAMGAAGPVWAGEVSTSEGKVVRHEIRERDTLMLLAGYYYKDPRQWKRIYSVNRDLLIDPNVILPGTVLKIEADPFRQWNIPYTDFLSRVFD